MTVVCCIPETGYLSTRNTDTNPLKSVTPVDHHTDTASRIEYKLQGRSDAQSESVIQDLEELVHGVDGRRSSDGFLS